MDGTASTASSPNTSTSCTQHSSTPATPPPPSSASTASCPGPSRSRSSAGASRNVAALVDPPAQRLSDIATAVDLGEARAVLEAAAQVRNPARWTVALALGLRQSEALALQWKDVDPVAGALTVRRSIHRVRGGGLVYEGPKSKWSRRALALPLPLVAELHRHKAGQLDERMLAGSEGGYASTFPGTGRETAWT